MDTEKERCTFLWCVLSNTVEISDIVISIMNAYTNLMSIVSFLVGRKSESLTINLRKTSLADLKLAISNKFLNGKKVEKLSAQYFDIDKYDRRKNHIRYGYVLLVNDNDCLIEHLRDGHHLSL
jgi:hypothetical protein